MPASPWSELPAALALLREVLAVPGDDPEALSRALEPLVAHRALAIMAGGCTRSPVAAAGEPGVAERVTIADLAHLAATVVVGEPWQGRASIAGEDRAVIAAAAAPEDPDRCCCSSAPPAPSRWSPKPSSCSRRSGTSSPCA